MRRFAPAAMAVTLALAGCGATPPQAPLGQAKKLDESLGGISTACGETYQLTAFPGNHEPDLTTLEVTANSDAQKLAGVYKQNRKWIYQNETVEQLVQDSISMLRSCGLSHAADTLSAAQRTG